MNQCLAIPTENGALPVKTTPARGEVVELSCDAVVAKGECAAGDAACAPVPEKGKVLLLDDDPTLREIITLYLAEHGYKVVAVQNGGEGVREVLASDFTLVLCDFVMPGLPGDLFYRAVERIRPDLCERFVFMTGHRDDAKTNEFIRKINGFVLWKPFQMKELGDALVLQEVRYNHRSVFENVPIELPPSCASLVTGENRVRPQPHPQPHAGVNEHQVARILARSRPDPVPVIPLEPPTPEEEEVRGGVLVRFAVACLVLLAAFAGAWMQIVNARERVAAASARQLALETEWESLSPRLETVAATRSKIAADQKRFARISADRTGARWTPILRAMIPSVGDGIAIRDVHVRGEPDAPGGCEVRVTGVATGLQPRLLADRFLRTVQNAAVENSKGRPVGARFEQIDDEQPGAEPDEKRATFVVLATLGSSPSSVAQKREGR